MDEDEAADLRARMLMVEAACAAIKKPLVYGIVVIALACLILALGLTAALLTYVR